MATIMSLPLLHLQHGHTQLALEGGASSSSLARQGFSGRFSPLNATFRGSKRAIIPCATSPATTPTTRQIAPKPQDPLRSFPWDLAAKRFAARLSDLVWSALKWLTIPFLLVSSSSELAYTLVQGKALFVPLSMLVGIVFAGIMDEVAKEVSPALRKGFPFHLVVIGFAFALIKLPGPSYPFWGRIILPHLANGGLWQTCYLVWRGLRMKA